MKENKISIKINCPIKEVFKFTINPKSTPKWIDGIVKEETNEWPVKIGTIYRNKSDDNIWNEYGLVEFEPEKLFTLKQKNSNYSVQYTYKSLSENLTELTYYEWVDKGELENPFTIKTLEKLKQILEK
ncbi:MAG: SRPBCC family protein [bacterium]